MLELSLVHVMPILNFFLVEINRMYRLKYSVHNIKIYGESRSLA